MSPRRKRTSKPRRRRLEVAAAVALVVTPGPILSGVFVVASDSANRIYTTDGGVLARNVIVVLSTKVDPGRPSGFLTARLNVAIDLSKSGRGEVILVAGANTAESDYETQTMEDYLISRDIPAGRVMQDITNYDTYDSYIQIRGVFGVREMTVVSQAYHLPRTVATCRALGVDAIGMGDVTAQRNRPERYLQEELREFPAYVKMQLDLLHRAKAAQSSPSNTIQDTLRGS